MTIRTSLTITGDTEGAQKAVADLAATMDRASTSAEGLASSERVAEAATENLQKELNQTLTTVGALENDVRGAQVALAGLSGGAVNAGARIAGLSAAGQANAKALAAQSYGARNFAQQIQDMAVMGSVAGDSLTNWLRVLTSQIGQVAYSAEQMGAKGALGEAAKFMNTPWGAAATGAAMILLPLAANLLTASDNAGQLEDRLNDAASASDAFGDAQSLLGKIMDLTTGKMKSQNLVLVESIKLQAQLNILKAQEKIDAAAGNRKPTGDPVFDALPENDMRRLGGPRGDVMAARQIAEMQSTAPQVKALRDQLIRQINNDALAKSNPSQYADVVGGQLTVINQQLDAMAVNGKVAGKSLLQVKTEFLELANAGVSKAANMEVVAAATTGDVPDDLKRDAKDKKRRTPRTKSTASRDEFGRDAADRIAGIAESFTDTPDAIQKADKALRQLDDIIDDLARKKPPNFDELIESAQRAKVVVENGLVRALVEGFKAPETAADKAAEAIGQLDKLLAAQAQKLAAGDIGQAAFDAFKGQIDKSRAVIEEGLNRPYEQFIQGQEDALRIQGLIAQGRTAEAEALRAIIQLEKDRAPLDDAHKAAILASVQALQAEQRAADVLRDKRQKDVDAVHEIKDVTMDAVRAWDRGDLAQLVKTPGKLLDAFMNLGDKKLFEKIFGDLFRELEDEASGTTVVKDASARMATAVDTASRSIASLGAAADKAALAISGDGWAGGVQGGTNGLGLDDLFGTKPGGDSEAEAAIEVVGKVLKPQMDVFQRAIGGAVEHLADLFTNPENAKQLGKNIGEFAGKGLEGAATGTMIAGLGNALGIKMNPTGSQIGGAIGNFLPIPGGSIIGSIAGGLIGNMFTKPAYGTATLSNTSSSASLRGRAGAEVGAGGAAEQVQSGLQDIAKQLGGSLGNFAVSIGTFDGKWRVSTTGFSGQLDSKTARGQGLHDFGKDGEQAAIAFAIQDAIADGAITGLSVAVQKAIRSNPDIDKALEEALKVADLEQLLGGLPAELAKQFEDFETEAADRLRIAREYGFDIVKTEELNAKQRAALSKQLLDQQVGSLQKLIDEMTSGSMFEGTKVDQRSALLAAIEKAKADLDNGVEGAADTLADLFGQLNTVSKDVYGTTGGFAADRSEILDQARAAIAAANARIAQAQQQASGSDPALATTNAALDENNDQNARMLSLLGDIRTLLSKAGVADSDLSALMAAAKVA